MSKPEKNLRAINERTSDAGSSSDQAYLTHHFEISDVLACDWLEAWCFLGSRPFLISSHRRWWCHSPILLRPIDDSDDWRDCWWSWVHRISWVCTSHREYRREVEQRRWACEHFSFARQYRHPRATHIAKKTLHFVYIYERAHEKNRRSLFHWPAGNIIMDNSRYGWNMYIHIDQLR